MFGKIVYARNCKQLPRLVCNLRPIVYKDTDTSAMCITTCDICWLFTFLLTIYNLVFIGGSSSKTKAKQSRMSAISVLQRACLNKPFKSFKDLEVGEYKIERFDYVESTFGDRVRIKLSDSYMFLPQRYIEEMSDEVIKELNVSTVYMTYSGKDQNNQNRLMLEFNAVGMNEEGAPEA